MSDEQFQKMLNVEHGGMNELLADVYVITGDGKYLDLAERFCHRLVLDPLSQHRDTLTGLHSNTQIPKFIGFNRLYALTGKSEYLSASAFFWQTVVTTRSFATGGNADTEHFFDPAKFQHTPRFGQNDGNLLLLQHAETHAYALWAGSIGSLRGLL